MAAAVLPVAMPAPFLRIYQLASVLLSICPTPNPPSRLLLLLFSWSRASNSPVVVLALYHFFNLFLLFTFFLLVKLHCCPWTLSGKAYQARI